MNELFRDLVHHTHAVMDRHGEAHLACPECGHESSPRDPHCSFNDRGWHCFSCGAGGSLSGLAEKIGMETRPYNAPVRIQKAPGRPAAWIAHAEHLCDQYQAHSASWRLWQAYKPVPVGVYNAQRLGVGVLPASKCPHERLIVPIIDGTEIVGFRGRAIDCDCGKWLAPGGTRISLYPLYNEPALHVGAIVWIVENPIDALLVRPYTGVAIYSVSYWEDRWEKALLASRPGLVVVALDNDLVGNGGAARRGEFMQNWLEKHPRVPDPAGIKIANRLLINHINVVIYDWGSAAYKADIGSLIMQEV